mmetsp:Transcript_3904/g.5950  ORF Transcript_3904/g.5950 Transcript_3904/m.5950 type:complete len:548 (+) Transcript_3904:63-1706(+)
MFHTTAVLLWIVIGKFTIGLFLLRSPSFAFTVVVPTALPCCECLRMTPSTVRLPPNFHISSRSVTSLKVRFTRDTLDDHMPVDEGAVIGLIKERKIARRAQNFAKADAVLDKLLKEHSVILDDKTKKWRTIDQSRQRIKKARRGGKVGPYGHDFVICPDAGPMMACALSEDKIHAMIAERMIARKSKEFKKADQIRDELKDQGVYLDDNTRQWRADGKSFNKNKGSNPKEKPISRSSFSSHLHQDDVDCVLDLLAQRLRFKRNLDFVKADAIRDELLEQYNVHINDRLGEWSVGGNFGENKRDNRHGKSRGEYVKSPYSADLPLSQDEEYVQNRVDERLQGRKNGDFDLADAIRQELLVDFGVMIQDTINQWSVGGDFGPDAPANRAEYTWRRGRGDDNLSPKQITGITNIVAKRVEAKRARNFELADEIRNRLFERFKVRIDDKAFQWYVDDNVFAESSKMPKEGQGEDTETITRESLRFVPITDDIESKESSSISEKEDQGDNAEATAREALMSLTVAQLKERLRDHGKKVGGKKQELVDRLLLA